MARKLSKPTNSEPPPHAFSSVNAQTSAAPESKGSLRKIRKLVEKLYLPATRLKSLRERQLLIVAVTLRTVGCKEPAHGVVDGKLRATPDLEQIQIANNVVVHKPA